MENDKKLEDYNRKAQPIREAINAQPLTRFYPLEKSQGGLYICPICGSGTHRRKTGALSIDPKTNHVTCFAGSCFGETGTDTLGALRVLYGESEREVFERCGYRLTGTGAEAPQITRPRETERAEEGPKQQDFGGEIARYAAALEGSEGATYLQARGITAETMKRFRLGYDADRHCVTIPYNVRGSYYGRRTILPSDRICEDRGKYDKLPRAIAGPEPLFNGGALYFSDVVFVTEGALDAISLEQAGGSATALNGTGYTKLLNQIESRRPSGVLVLCLDNDEKGREAAARLGEKLDEKGMQHVDGTAAIMGAQTDPEEQGYRKDPNEVLQKDGTDALRQAIREIVEDARERCAMAKAQAEEERKPNTGAGTVDAFLASIKTRRFEPIPTGLKDLDTAIGGGFMRQQLVLLGAAPGMGKTALAQWLFEGMAQRGLCSCVYLNLEMSREQMLARSFARIAAAQGARITTCEILQGYKWTQEQEAAVMNAAREYRSTIADRMFYNPEGTTANLEEIMRIINAEANRAEEAGAVAPCVVIDYLQIISGKEKEDAATTMKRAVLAFKDYAIKRNTVVFVIMAHNRESNKSGAISMESGRDTSALEYSADLQMGLAYTKLLKAKERGVISPDKDRLTSQERQLLSLKILKSRFAEPGRKIDLRFDGGAMSYTPIDAKHGAYQSEDEDETNPRL